MHDRAGEEFWAAMDEFLNALNISARRKPVEPDDAGKQYTHRIV